MGERPTALVTGASSGIGLEFAKQLAGSGHDVVLVARDVERLKELASQLSVTVDVEVLPADLTDVDQRAEVERRLRDDAKPIDVLINNAGLGTTGLFADLPTDGEDREIQLNVVALTRLTSAALPGMVKRGRGKIVNVASIAGFQPSPGNAVYGATKAYVISFTQALREELRGTGVHATALCPGFTKTEFQERANYETKGVGGFLWQTPEQVVRPALKAVNRNASLCTPGAQNKIAGTLVHLLPRAVQGRVARLISGQV
jgi:short-subunit dehydrogenase